MDRLAACAAGPTDYMAVVREFIGSYSQRGLVVIISDFLDDRGCERALQYLADFGHELMLLQIWADEDRAPPWTGELELRDAETGAGLKLDFDDEARRRYTHAFDEYAAAIQTMAHAAAAAMPEWPLAPLESVIFGDLIRMRGDRMRPRRTRSGAVRAATVRSGPRAHSTERRVSSESLAPPIFDGIWRGLRRVGGAVSSGPLAAQTDRLHPALLGGGGTAGGGGAAAAIQPAVVAHSATGRVWRCCCWPWHNCASARRPWRGAIT